MPIPDRFWWLERTGGILVALITAGFAVFAFLQFWNVGLGPSDIDGLLGTTLCVIAVAILAVFGQAIFTIRGSSRSQDRFRRRLAAIHGDQEAIPQSDISLDPGRTPDISTERVELLWRATRLSRRFYTILYVIVCIVFGGFWLLPLFVIYLAATTKPIKPWTFDLPTVGGIVSVIALFVASPLVVGIFTAYLPTERGKPYGVSAGGEGITYYPQVGRSRLIRWEEMRLLEVATTDSYPQKRHSYRLYGRNSIAQWFDSPPNAWASLDMSKDEFVERHQALLDLIAARTGLVPRTFDPPTRRGRRIR